MRSFFFLSFLKILSFLILKNRSVNSLVLLCRPILSIWSSVENAISSAVYPEMSSIIGISKGVPCP